MRSIYSQLHVLLSNTRLTFLNACSPTLRKFVQFCVNTVGFTLRVIVYGYESQICACSHVRECTDTFACERGYFCVVGTVYESSYSDFIKF